MIGTTSAASITASPRLLEEPYGATGRGSEFPPGEQDRPDGGMGQRHPVPYVLVLQASGSRWLLLRNGENIRPEERVRLSELLAANRQLATVYILAEDLKRLWRYRYPAAALRFFEEWYRRAIRSRIESLKAFARRLKERLHGILAHCRYPSTRAS